MILGAYMRYWDIKGSRNTNNHENKDKTRKTSWGACSRAGVFGVVGGGVTLVKERKKWGSWFRCEDVD